MDGCYFILAQHFGRGIILDVARKQKQKQISDPVRVFVLGGESPTFEVSRIRDGCDLLGEHLGSSGYSLVVCSAHESSADAWVVRGFAKSSKNRRGSVVVHRPRDSRKNLSPGDSVSEQWDRLVGETRIENVSFVDNAEADLGTQSFSSAYLLCQIQALRSSQVVVAIGGKDGGSAAHLLAMARDDYPIVPLACYGGTGLNEFRRKETELRLRVRDASLVDALHSEEAIKRIDLVISGIRRAHGRRRVFLSYAWSRAADADFVEAYLRRSPSIELFRDEFDIVTGEQISDRVANWIDSSDVVLALWCKEYVASPHCYDEMHRALRRNNCLLYVMRLDATRPVWPTLRKGGDWREKWLEAFPDKATARESPELIQRIRREKMAASLEDLINKINRAR